MGERHKEFVRPFRALDHGVEGHGREKYRRLFRGIYLDPSVEVTARIKAEAAWLYGRGGAVLGGRSAAAMLGVKYLDDRRRIDRPPGGRSDSRQEFERFDPEPAVLIRPRSAGRQSSAGLVIHRINLPDAEMVTARGIRRTSAARTAFDLARWPASSGRGWKADSRGDLERRVTTVDAVCNKTKITFADIEAIASAHPRARGVDRVRSVLDLVDGGADSPPETHLRLLLIRSGFPRPTTQYLVRHEDDGAVFAQIDLAWPEWKVGLEYDGDWHRESADQITNDINRYATYEKTGWRVITVDKWLLYSAPVMVIERAGSYLRSAGARFG